MNKWMAIGEGLSFVRSPYALHFCCGSMQLVIVAAAAVITWLEFSLVQAVPRNCV